MLNAAFGKSGAQLIPMLGDLAEQMKAAELYGNIIDPRSIKTAQLFGNTVNRIKTMIKSFGDTARAGIVRHITPYVMALQEWIAANRELIRQKIEAFIKKGISAIQKIIPVIIKAAGKVREFIDTVKPFALWALDNLPKILPLVVGIVSAFLLFNAAAVAINSVNVALATFKLIMGTGPLGIILLIVSALIAGITFLSQRVGGLWEALEVIGETAVAVGKVIIKALVSPLTVAINFVIDLVRSAISIIGMIPGMEDKMSAVNSAVEGYQKNFKYFWELNTDDFTAVVEPYKSRRAEYLERKESENEKSDFEKLFEEKMKEVEKLLSGINGGVKSLNDGSAQGVPGRLNYAAMGQEDFFSIARKGFY
jgi:hypothetical protein